MEKVCKELNEIRAENEILRADNRSKTELLEILKRAQNEQLTRIEETSLIIDKKDQELNEIQLEVSMMRQIKKDLEQSLCKKSLIIKHLSSDNDKLRADAEEKFQNFEKENGRMLFALEEANKKKIDLEEEVKICRAQIEGLKSHLSASNKKLIEALNDSKCMKEIRGRDEMLMRYEEEKIHLEQKLKWKEEQFGHLEEAHEKIKNQFKISKKEWEQEKVMLLDEISSMQTKFESQTRILKDVQKALQMCNNALAHEETWRKNLEAQVSELKIRFEEVFTDPEDARWNPNGSRAASENEVANLRQSLSTKEIYLKEIKYQKQKLEQENIELLASVKKLQEAAINGSGNSSLAKLKTRLRSIEQNHKKCNANFRAKEAEWSSQMTKISEDLNKNRFRLEIKESELKEIEIELECSQSSAIVLKFENEIISAVLSSIILEARPKFSTLENDKENELSETNKTTQELHGALNSANSNLEQCERNESLIRKFESFDQVGENREKELEKLKKKLAEVSMALKMANSKLEDKTNEASELKFESWVWKSIAERYRPDLKESKSLRKRLEASLLAQVEFAETIRKEKDELVSKLEATSSAGMERTEDAFVRMMGEKDIILEDFSKLVEFLENESIRRELEAAVFEHVTAEKRFEIEEENLVLVSREKDMILKDLREEVEFLEKELIRRELEAAVFEHIKAGKKFEIEKENLVLVSREKDMIMEDSREEQFLQNETIKRELEAAVFEHIKAEKRFESEKENLVLVSGDKDVLLEDLREEVEFLEDESIRRELEAAVFEHIKAEKRFESEKEHLFFDFKISLLSAKEHNDRLQEEIRTLDDLLNSKSSSEKENLLRFADEFDGFVSTLLEEDTELMEHLGRMMKSGEEFSDSSKENFNKIGLLRTSLEKETLLILAKEFEDYITRLCEEDTKFMGDLGKMMKSGDEFLDSSKENLDMDASFQAVRKQDIVSGIIRSPFKQLN